MSFDRGRAQLELLAGLKETPKPCRARRKPSGWTSRKGNRPRSTASSNWNCRRSSARQCRYSIWKPTAPGPATEQGGRCAPVKNLNRDGAEHAPVSRRFRPGVLARKLERYVDRELGPP